MYEGFLPTTKQEMDELHIEQFDFIYITGDAYVDHPSFGAAIVTRLIRVPWIHGRDNLTAGLAWR